MRHREYIGKMEITSILEERLDRLNNVLKQNEVQLCLEKDEYGQGILLIAFDKREKNERNAGRKRLDVSGERTALWRVSDVKASMKEIGNDETARLLGCSRATLYRRLKELKGKDDWLFY